MLVAIVIAMVRTTARASVPMRHPRQKRSGRSIA
jgi:hypothetical protein